MDICGHLARGALAFFHVSPPRSPSWAVADGTAEGGSGDAARSSPTVCAGRSAEGVGSRGASVDGDL